MSSRARYIDGIDRFCDGWCAKCPSTAQCETFARSRRLVPIDAPGGAADPRALKFLRALVAAALQALHSVLDDEAAENGAAMPGAALAASAPGAPRDPGPPARDTPPTAPLLPDPLMVETLSYLHAIGDWFADERGWLLDRRVTLRARVSASADPVGVVADLEALVAALETIAWDAAVVPDRVARAIDASGADPASADGHAKVALLSIDRSIEAWLAVRRARRGLPESTVPLLRQLAGLGRQLEAAFPRARRFLRPGLDVNPGVAARPDPASPEGPALRRA